MANRIRSKYLSGPARAWSTCWRIASDHPRRSHAHSSLLLLILLLNALPVSALGQITRPLPNFTVSYQATSLSEALSDLSKRTSVTIAYESEIVAGLRVFCIEEDKPFEFILTCLLRDSGLDYFRLSSGAYVLAKSAQQAPLYGYLKGVILDRGTGAPLANANILLATYGIGTATNSSGNFSLPALRPGDYEIVVSHISYEPWKGTLTIDPGGVQTTQIGLNSSAIHVSPIIVDDSDLTTWMASASYESTGTLGNPNSGPVGDPFKHLNELSGVRINDVSADVRVDGTAQGELLMQLDGVPVFLPQTNIGLIGPFSSLAINEFDVYRVGFGVRPGSFVSGVVNARHGASDDGLSHLQVDPSGINARIRFGSRESRLSGMVAGRIGLWKIFAPSALSDALSSWSAADPFLLVAATRQYYLATTAFITDSLQLRVNTKPAVRYDDVHITSRYRFSPLRSVDGSLYVGRNNLAGNRTSSSVQSLIAGDTESRVTDLSIGDDYNWTNVSGQLRYSTFFGNNTFVQLQGKASVYQLRHNYELIEDLFLPGLPEAASPNVANLVADVSDLNDVRYGSFAASIDHVRDHHEIGAGVDISLYETDLRLRSSAINETTDILLSQAPLASFESAAVQLKNNLPIIGGYVEDQWEPYGGIRLTSGLRITALPELNDLFFEPKLSLRTRGKSAIGLWATQTSAGLYRQFLIQADVSKLNAGSLLPTVRVWIPVDANLRPPSSYHLLQTVSLQPNPSFSLVAEGFAKINTHGVRVNYASLATTALGFADEVSAFNLFTSTHGRILGASLKGTFNSPLLSAGVRLGLTEGYIQSDSLFFGKRFSPPGVDPRELDIHISVRPTSSITARVAWRHASGRSHGLTSAYYDYFGHSAQWNQHQSFDFSDPDAHVLPAHQQLDASIAVARRMGNVGVQVRADMLNLLDRANVSEWKLLFENGQLVRSPRPLYPRLTTLSLRLSW